MTHYLQHALAFAFLLPLWMMAIVPILLWWANKD